MRPSAAVNSQACTASTGHPGQGTLLTYRGHMSGSFSQIAAWLYRAMVRWLPIRSLPDTRRSRGYLHNTSSHARKPNPQHSAMHLGYRQQCTIESIPVFELASHLLQGELRDGAALREGSSLEDVVPYCIRHLLSLDVTRGLVAQRAVQHPSLMGYVMTYSRYQRV